MPYIPQELRPPLDKLVDAIVNELSPTEETTDGKLNYFITRTLDSIYGGRSYLMYERAIGLLECIKLELYRKRIAPYEERKRLANGEVFLGE